MLRTAFLRNSSLMGSDCQPEARRAPRVVGRDSGTAGIVIDATVPREPSEAPRQRKAYGAWNFYCHTASCFTVVLPVLWVHV